MKRKIGFLSSLFKPKSLGVKILFAVALFLVIYLLYNRLTEEFSLLKEVTKSVKDTTEKEDAAEKAAEAENEVGDRDDERKKAAQRATEAQRVAEAQKAAALRKVAQAKRAAALANKTRDQVKGLALTVDAAKSTASTAVRDAKIIGGGITKSVTSGVKKIFSF
jgi:hypothetical protein